MGSIFGAFVIMFLIACVMELLTTKDWRENVGIGENSGYWKNGNWCPVTVTNMRRGSKMLIEPEENSWDAPQVNRDSGNSPTRCRSQVEDLRGLYETQQSRYEALKLEHGKRITN